MRPTSSFSLKRSGRIPKLQKRGNDKQRKCFIISNVAGGEMKKILLQEKLAELLQQHFQSQSQISNFDIADILHSHGDGVSALLYSQLFVPNLIEIDGSVLLNFYPDIEMKERFLAAKKDTKLSLMDLEASFNLLEIPYIFSNRKSSDDDDLALANLIAEAWRGRLAYTYPNRLFVVRVLSNSIEPDIAVQFFEERASPNCRTWTEN
ncbi:MAG: hypothetical protein ACOH12_14740 [Parvibaculaceae bacterium]